MKKIVVMLTVLVFCMVLCQIASMAECPVTGVYQSDWGTVQLTEKGSVVTGRWVKGTVSGIREGDTIHYTWYEGKIMGGKGVWTVSPDCKTLTGTWGHGDSETGGGYWNLQK